MEEILEEYSAKNELFILVGDLNINVAKNTYYSNRLKNIIRNNGLYQKIDKFTRITRESATIIDLLITNEKEIPFTIHLTPKITDHCIITVDIKSRDKQESFIKKYRNFKHFNELNFQLDLMDNEWLPDCTDTNVLAEKLARSLINVLDKHAPVEEKVLKCSWANKMWWTPTIGQEILERDRLYRTAVITQQEEDWRYYKQKRNAVVNGIRQQKEIFYQEKIDEVKDNPVEMWKTLKQLVKSNKKENNKEGIIFNNEMEKNKQTIANKFNAYFLNSLEELVTYPNQDQINEFVNNMTECNVKLERFKLLEFYELRKIVNEMKIKKSSVDGITTTILQSAFEIIGDRFLQVINSSLEDGCFPITWKLSTIIPLEKKINTIKCEEHRPINMVPTYEKLLEIIVNDQIKKYVEDNNLLTKYQAGFRNQNSCESAIQTVLAKWKNALIEKKVIGVVFLDFRRAFETINRNLLLLKLKNYGLGDTIIKWFSEYLSNRTQVTKYNDTISTSKQNIFGVPQGTVLGPTLFLLYINDIVQYVQKCNIQLFADDTLLYYIGDDVDEIINTLNDELKTLQTWLKLNSMYVNIEKTKFMLIKCRHNKIDTSNHMGIYIYIHINRHYHAKSYMLIGNTKPETHLRSPTPGLVKINVCISAVK